MELILFIKLNCPACAALRSIITEYVDIYPQANSHIYLMNIEDPTKAEYVRIYEVVAAPTLLLVNPDDEVGKFVARSIGVTDLKSLEKFLDGRLVNVGIGIGKSGSQLVQGI